MGISWSEDQKKVIETRNRNLLVSAAAGSGKTAVLVERIIRLITDPRHPMDIDRLLVVTFTNAAAAEMRERIGEAILSLLEECPEDGHLQRQATLVHHARITTIHSFCLGLLRSHFNQLDLDPAFRIGDEGELMLLQAEVMEQLLEDSYHSENPEFEKFADTYATGKTDRELEDYILFVYRFAISNPWPEDWISRCRSELGSDTPDELEKLSWMDYLRKDAAVQLSELAELAGQAVCICEQEEGLAPYLPMLIHDRQQLEELSEAEDYVSLSGGLAGFVFDTLGRVKKDSADPECKEAAADIRDLLKKSVKKLKELYCSEDIETVCAEIEGSREAVLVLLDLTLEFSRRYQEKKKEKNLVDFNDLEHFALKVLVSREEGKAVPTPAAVQLSRQYEEILIDEYQDSNYVQEALMNSISREREGCPNLFMVGDVKQSIYRFRLARPELFMEKYDTYSTEDSLYQKIELHQNFRSRDSVLESINQVFYRIMAKSLGNIDYTQANALHPGAVYEKTDRTAGTPTELWALDAGADALKQMDEESADYTVREMEAKLIARRIRELTDETDGLFIWDKEKKEYRTAQNGDIVILLRSVSGWAEVFTNLLMDEGIPSCAESRTGYFNTVEVETVLSMLSVIDNPMQDIPLAAVLKSPVGSISDEELSVISSLYKNLAEKRGRGLYCAVRHYLDSMDEEDPIRQKLSCVMELFADLSRKSRYLSIHELIYELFSSTGYYDYVSAMPSGEIRKANLDMLAEKAIAYESTSYHGLFHFIRYIEKLKKFNTDFGEASVNGRQKDTVRIMSIHKSKGLEFPIVILAGMGKSFNKQDTAGRILIDPDLGIATDYLDLEHRIKTPTLKKNVLKRRIELENLGEELRVLYVAMTRAKEKLIMTGSDRSLQKKMDKWNRNSNHSGKTLPFIMRSAASSYLDWVLMSLMPGQKSIEVHSVSLMELTGREVQEQMTRAFRKEELFGLDLEQVYDQECGQHLEQVLAYQYPYQADVSLHTKISVSELKKPGQLVDEEESEFLPTLPRFMEEEDKGVLGGPVRGTAYHRALELLPFSEIRSREETERELKRLLEEKRLLPEAYELLDARIIWKFISSSLGIRMAKAQAEGRLYREQQFVMGIPAREMNVADTGELVLVQGILDACFEEDGQLVLVDYKTDRVKPGQEPVLIDRYRAQLDYYEKALEQMTLKKVKEKAIYSLALQREIFL